MIRKVGEGSNAAYVISSDQVAIPGCYESERAAKYAFRFSNQILQQLQDTVNEQEADHNKRVITFKVLQEAAKQQKHK